MTATKEAGAAQANGGTVTVRPQLLRLSPYYRRARDSILRPHLRLTESRYFWEKWKPRLGADAAVLIMEVRDRCNRSLGLTDGATIPLPEGTTEGTTVSAVDLAAACGFSRVTLWRLLQREDVRQFVRVEHNYVYDRRIGKRRRTVSTYHVLMEDPLVPEDEPRLQALLETGNGAATAGTGMAGETWPSGPKAPTFQTETEVVDNSPPTFHSETTESGSNGKPQNVQRTLVKERLAGTSPVPTRSAARGGQPARLGSLLSEGALGIGRGSAGGSGAPPVRVPSPDGGGPRSGRAPDVWRSFPEFAHFVEEAETLLQDRHSRGFYVTALKVLYPQHMPVWHRALTAAREETKIRRSRGALFTRLLRTFAAEAGVAL
jgi:hypothetical protein